MPTQLIERIYSGSLSEQELINLYNNVRDKNVPEVVAAIESQMRGKFPRAANRLFGKKEAFAVETLQSVITRLEAEVNLSGNKLKNGVKPGGQKLAGEKYLNVYASYRNGAGVGAYLSLEQDSFDTELYAIVGKYKVGDNAFRDKQRFTMESFDQAADEYIRLVKEVAVHKSINNEH